MTHDVYTLPPNLPVPEDDGAADHLLGTMLPQLTLESSRGPVSLRELARERLVLYVYPRAGRPGRPPVAGWDEIPGARGCTPQSCAFRDHADDLAGLGALVAGLSVQPLDDQIEFAERNHIPYPVIADPERKLGSGAEPADVRRGRRDAVQADHARRGGVRRGEGLLSGVPAGPERRRGRRLAPLAGLKPRPADARNPVTGTTIRGGTF